MIGSIAALDLRLLGVFRSAPLGALARPLSQVAIAGVFCAAFTGLLLLSVRPIAYAGNPAFQVKLVLVALVLANAAALRAAPGWRRALAGEGAPARVRAQALLSLLLWAGAVLAGRWIGFLQ